MSCSPAELMSSWDLYSKFKEKHPEIFGLQHRRAKQDALYNGNNCFRPTG